METKRFSRTAVVPGFALAVLLVGLGFTRTAWGYLPSEEQQFQADVNEAKARAHDFERTLKEAVEDEKARQKAAQVAKKENAREAEETDRSRQRFVHERDVTLAARMRTRDAQEREDEKEQKKFEDEMERARKAYILKRDRVRRIIERDARIDEAKEYGLSAGPVPAKSPDRRQ